jgi:hypothetical protein
MNDPELLEECPIREIPTQEEWSENFALAGFDPESGVDIFLHIGRWRKNLALWREVVTIALADGTILAHRGIGNARANDNGPGGPNLEVRILEPFRRLSWQYVGAARRVRKEDLLRERLTPGQMEPLEFCFTFSSDFPVWNLAYVGANTEFMGRGHVEQLGRVVGEVRFGSERFGFNSLINRDHSRGPRVVDSNRRHTWMHGVFENGIAFLFYEAEISCRDEPAYSEACVYEGGKIYPAAVKLGSYLPLTNNMHLIEQPVPFTLEYPGGTFHITADRFPTTISNQYTSPYEQQIGRREYPDRATRSYLEQSALFTLNDKVRGYGHMERTVPGDIVREP